MTVAAKIAELSLETVQLEVRENVLTITIAQEKTLNALSKQVITDLRAAVQVLRDGLGKPPENGTDWSVRGVILTGAGEKSFVAGANIAEMSAMDSAQAAAYTKDAQELTRWLEELPVPVIAAVNGYALGGGCEIAMACDYIYASENALFGQPEVALGLIPGFGGTVRLQRYVGAALAREIILTDKRLSAAAAQRAGLVNEIFASREELLAAAHKSLQQAAKQSAAAIAISKQTIAETERLTVQDGLAHECAAFTARFGKTDMVEGTAAFVAKRPANFSE
ncbi:MAG: enoyl-CoA hydratase-related protein [Microbacteriaceae bacterium]|nr:enoyl-CoA hydratase-related protein [Microbacteriaceae bacterium]